MAQLSRRAASFANSVTGCSCQFILNTENHPYSGGECTIFAFEAKGKKIGARIEQKISPVTRVKVEREIQFLQAITRERIHHVPRLIGYDLESTPPLIAMSWADGNTLKWADFSPPLQIRNNILKTIAEVTLDLLKIQEPGGSAVEWITSKIYRTRMCRSIQGNLPGVSVNDCEALMHRVSDFHLPAFDSWPNVLVHGDLHPDNIITNAEQVECIVDWGFATMVPLQFSAVYPRFLTNEPRLVEDKFDWSQCAYSQTQKDDRSFYLQCIIDMAPAKGEYARVYSEILARDDQEERYWWLSAVNRLDIMRALKTKPQSSSCH